MAEVAAGLVIAFEVVTTGVEGGAIGAWALRKPTLPLHASFSCFAQVSKLNTPDSLARFSHTISIVNGDLYIFGGQVSDDKLAGDEMHILKMSNWGGLGPQYKAVPAVARDGDDVPQARAGHTACVVNDRIVIFGGYADPNDPSKPLDEKGRVWIFHPDTLHWSHLDVANGSFPSRSCHAAAIHGQKLIIHGGYEKAGEQPRLDTWMFDMGSRMWVELAPLKSVPDTPTIIATAPPHFALLDDKLHVVTASSASGSQVHTLDVSAPDTTQDTENQTSVTDRQWEMMEYRTNPKTLSPEPRKGAGLVPISAGLGRNYLMFMLGAKEDSLKAKEVSDFWTNSWSLQLPSSSVSPAQVKDTARDKLGLNSHEAEWAEVELVVDQDPEKDPPAQGLGKSHPGPRSNFACTTFSGDNVIVLWGGRDPKGEPQGNGWVVHLKA